MAEGRQAIDRFGKGMSGSVAAGMAKFHVGLLAVKSALGAVRGAIQGVLAAMAGIDETQKFADRLGVSADQLTILGFAAEQTGASTNDLNTSIEKMSRSVAEAAAGTGEAKDALAKLGLSVDSLMIMSPDQQFAAIADAIKGVGNASDKTAIVMDIFGRSGGKLVNMLDLGSDGLNKFGKEAEDMGLLLGENRRGVEAANDAINKMKRAWGGLIQKVAVMVAPALEAIANVLGKIVGAFSRMFGMSGEAATFGGSVKAAAAAFVPPAEKAIEKLTDTFDKNASDIVAKSKKAAVDIARITTPGIGAVTRRSQAGFGAVQQARRARDDRQRQHDEQLRAMAAIEAAIREGAAGDIPVRILT